MSKWLPTKHNVLQMTSELICFFRMASYYYLTPVSHKKTIETKYLNVKKNTYEIELFSYTLLLLLLFGSITLLNIFHSLSDSLSCSGFSVVIVVFCPGVEVVAAVAVPVVSCRLGASCRDSWPVVGTQKH